MPRGPLLSLRSALGFPVGVDHRVSSQVLVDGPPPVVLCYRRCLFSLVPATWRVFDSNSRAPLCPRKLLCPLMHPSLSISAPLLDARVFASTPTTSTRAALQPACTPTSPPTSSQSSARRPPAASLYTRDLVRSLQARRPHLAAASCRRGSLLRPCAMTASLPASLTKLDINLRPRRCTRPQRQEAPPQQLVWAFSLSAISLCNHATQRTLLCKVAIHRGSYFPTASPPILCSTCLQTLQAREWPAAREPPLLHPHLVLRTPCWVLRHQGNLR
jgi:hypothetical protein